MASWQRDYPVFQPRRVALTLVMAYAVVCGAYIWVSDWVAAGLADSVEQLRYLETVKGILFVAVSSILLFVMAWGLLKLIARQEMELVQRRNALVETERQATAGLFASSVAHDINNILMALRFDLDELKQGNLCEEDARIVEQVLKATDDLAVMARRLMASGKRQLPGDFVETDLADIVRETVAYVKMHAPARPRKLDVEVDEAAVVRANPTLIRQMVSNLLLNAIDATEPNGAILVRLRKGERDLCLEVHDDGPGIPRERQETIFTDLTSTKTHGCGLGLLSVKVYAEAHRGKVEVCDSYLGGACFRAVLPMYDVTRHGILAEVF